MKTFFLIVAALAAAHSLAPSAATAAPGCNLPQTRPLWIDFGDGSVPFWDRIFARPGVIAAASNFLAPPRLRAAGAKTVYWDMHLKNRVGTPVAPASPSVIEDRADRLFLRAVASSDCATPVIALNELFGAGTATPWSAGNAQYRANVLAFVRRLSARGARPYLLVSSSPFTGGEAGQWWRDVSESADLVREVYFAGPRIHRQGALVGSRTMRVALRNAVQSFVDIGIPRARIGLMLGFHTTRGVGSGREGLQPTSAWLQVVKLEALAARQVARETGVGSVWSWGWGAWSEGERDADKEAAACVWLWARDARLCDAPRLAGPGFDVSRTEGQLPPGAVCMLGKGVVTRAQLASVARVTGDQESALSVLYARVVLREHVDVPPTRVRAAEAALVARTFGGSWPAYRAALGRAGASRVLARGVLADQLREAELRRRLRVAPASGAAILAFYETYSELPAREVAARTPLWWLGGRRRGVALESIAPASVLRLAARPGFSRVFTADGPVQVRALGPTLPLGAFPLTFARAAIGAALAEIARAEKFQSWLLGREALALRRTVCVRDELPLLEPVDVTAVLPFLAVR